MTFCASCLSVPLNCCCELVLRRSNLFFFDHWNLHGSASFLPGPRLSVLDTCPHGSTFARRVLHWRNQLQWYEGPPTTALELYFDFCFETMSQAPVRVGRVEWKVRHESVTADVASLRLGLQNHAWIQMMKWWVQHMQVPNLKICRCNSLFFY